MLKIERIDHTADEGVIVQADTLEDLFKAMAHEMFRIICPADDSIHEREEHSLSVEGDDYAELLVNWLSELNFLFQTEQILLAETTSLTLNEKRLHAKISADHYDPDRHMLATEIKAVTYHHLYVEKQKSGWKAQVIFDI